MLFPDPVDLGSSFNLFVALSRTGESELGLKGEFGLDECGEKFGVPPMLGISGFPLALMSAITALRFSTILSRSS